MQQNPSFKSHFLLLFVAPKTNGLCGKEIKCQSFQVLINKIQDLLINFSIALCKYQKLWQFFHFINIKAPIKVTLFIVLVLEKVVWLCSD